MYKYSNLKIEQPTRLLTSNFPEKVSPQPKFMKVVDVGVSAFVIPSEQGQKQKLSSSILARMLKLDHHNLKNAKYFEQKYDLTRETFIKIFNLYSVLSFKTIFKRIHGGYEEPLGETPGMVYKRI